MAAFLTVPKHLAPTQLVYRKDLPKTIKTIVDECLEHRKRGDTESAIRCGRQAQKLAEAQEQHAGESVAWVLLADAHREMDQIGPALESCQKAEDALLQSSYPLHLYAKAVIVYLRCLIRHSMGAYTEAFAACSQARDAFESAKDYWDNLVSRGHDDAAESQALAEKCGEVIKWIDALDECLASDLASTGGGIEVHIPVANGEEYEVARVEVGAYRFPTKVTIKGREYQLHYLENEMQFNENDPRLQVPWGTRHFTVCVSKDEEAGPYSSAGDYLLVKQGKQEQIVKMLEGPPPRDSIRGTLRKDDEPWEFGEFKRDDDGNIQFHSPPPPNIIGNGKREEVKGPDQELGIAYALLKLPKK